jgi:hypothetical protein
MFVLQLAWMTTRGNIEKYMGDSIDLPYSRLEEDGCESEFAQE